MDSLVWKKIILLIMHPPILATNQQILCFLIQVANENLATKK